MLRRPYLLISAAALLCLAHGCKHSPISAQVKPATPVSQQEKHRLPGEIVRTERMRDAYPIRLGMVALRGIGDASDPQEKSADLGVKLGLIGEKWVTGHCDVIAFDAQCLTPETYTQIRSKQKLFTGLLYTYASSIYEQPNHRGSVGVWMPSMANWELKTQSGAPVKHPELGGHWMDCGSSQWANYWGEHAERLARTYRADGVVAAEMPPGNSFLDDEMKQSHTELAKYHTFADKVDAASAFLSAVHKPDRFLIVPSAVGFDELIGRATLPLDSRRAEPRLTGRCWDEFDKLADGAWAEGWINPYWVDTTLPESFWEVQLEAADRADRFGDVFIASVGYSNPDELEYGLASYLLVAHHQGRVVFQPMPKTPGEPDDAGLSLKVMMREYSKYQSYFDVMLGASPQERQYIDTGYGMVWRRKYELGDVYVNSSDSRKVKVYLAGPVRTVRGETIKGFTLAPHSGIILMNPPRPPAADSK